MLYLLLIILSSFGASILLVEKKSQYPVRKIRVYLNFWLLKLTNKRFAKVINCATCSSFWISLVFELVCLIIFLLNGWPILFFWPLSGFISSGFTWIITDLLNSIFSISSGINNLSNEIHNLKGDK